VPQLEVVTRYLRSTGLDPAEVIRVDQYQHTLDLSIGSLMLGANPLNAELAQLTELIRTDMASHGVEFAFGRYGEARGSYSGEAFGGASYATNERRTEHLGIDIFCRPGTAVYAPLDSTVELVSNNLSPLDYGPVVVLRHKTSDGQPFYSLYGHLHLASTALLVAGQYIAKGDKFAEVGNEVENGGWTPHLHLQLILDMLQLGADFPGVVYPSQMLIWRQLCPNPALLFPLEDIEHFDASPAPQGLLKRRH